MDISILKRTFLFYLFLFYFCLSIDAVTTTKDGYVRGYTYSYDFMGNAEIHLTKAQTKDAYVQLNGKIDIIGFQKNSNLLKIKSLEIVTQEGKKHVVPVGIEKPVRFNLQNGVLEPFFFTEDGDSQTSLNIKRAILSMLQTTESATQTDIFGTCPTRTSVNTNGTHSSFISKSRDLSACSHTGKNVGQDVSYHYSDSVLDMKKSSIMLSEVHSDAVLMSGILEKVEVREKYLYRPFSVGESGVLSTVTSILKLETTTMNHVDCSKCINGKSVVFDNSRQAHTQHSHVGHILQALNVLVERYDGSIIGDSSAFFIDLIRVLRSSNSEDILAAYKLIPHKDDWKMNLFLDALFRAGSSDSTEATMSLIINKMLTPFQQKLAVVSLMRAKYVSNSALSTVESLLRMEDLSNDVYIAAGTLVGTYCETSRCPDPTWTTITELLASVLNGCSIKTKQDEDKVMHVLKGIKNIRLEGTIMDHLTVCVNDKAVKQRLRVAALEAFAANACYDRVKYVTLNILKDLQEDSEIRIQAYLTHLQCPDTHFVKEITKMINAEPSYQVGSFIKSSVENIQSSTNPAKKKLQDFFSDVEITKEFPTHFGKFSKNYELSNKWESFDMNTATEANVIFSQKSFLPKSASLNITAQIFGTDIQLLEMGVRQDNLDSLLESYMGPQGTFKKSSAQDLYSSTERITHSIMDKLMRKRPATNKMIKSEDHIPKDDMELDMFVKILGSESVFLSLGHDHPKKSDELVDAIVGFIESGINNKKFAHEVKRQMLFLDMEMSYPTSLGLPLKLNLQGALTAKLNFSGEVDFNKLFTDTNNAKISFSILPSVDVKLVGTMFIDADSVAVGLKVNSGLFTNTGSNLSLQVSQTGYELHVSSPLKEQVLIHASNEIMLFRRDKGQQDHNTYIQSGFTSKRRHHHCYKGPLKFFNELCFELSYPAQPQDFSKNDNLLTHILLNDNSQFYVMYKLNHVLGFTIRADKDENNEVRRLEIVSDVSGGHDDFHKLSLLLEMTHRLERHSLSAVISEKNVISSAEVALVMDENELSVGAQMTVDKHKAEAKVGVVQLGDTTYKPILLFKQLFDKQKLVEVEGTITAENIVGGTKYTFNSIRLNLIDNSMSLDGFMSYANQTYISEIITVDKYQHKTNIDLNLYLTDEISNGHINVRGDTFDEVDINFKRIWHESEKTLEFSTKGKERKSESYVEIFKFYNNLKEKTGDADYLSYNGEIYLWPLDFFLIRMKYETDKDNLDLSLTGKYKNHTGEFGVSTVHVPTGVDNIYAKIKIIMNENKGIIMEGSYNETSPNSGDFYGKVEMLEQKLIYEISAKEHAKETNDDMDVGLSAQYKHAGYPDIIHIDITLMGKQSLLYIHTLVSAASVKYLEMKTTANLETYDSMDMELFIKDTVKMDVDLDIEMDDLSAKGVVLFDFIKASRKVKWVYKFGFLDPQYDLFVEVYTDFERDDSKKIVFFTDTKYKKSSIDSKNYISLFGSRVDVNVKNSLTGKLKKGNLKEKQFVQIFTSTGKEFTYTKYREASKRKGMIKGYLDHTVSYKPTEKSNPTKLIYIHKGNVKPETYYGIDSMLKYVKYDGKDFVINMTLNHNSNDTEKYVDLKFIVDGAMCDKRTNVKMHWDLSKVGDDNKFNHFTLETLYGNEKLTDVTTHIQVSENEAEDFSFVYKLDAYFHLPKEIFGSPHRTLILSTHNNLVIPGDDEKYLKWSSFASTSIDDNIYRLESEGNWEEKDIGWLLSSTLPSYTKLTWRTNMKFNDDDDIVRVLSEYDQNDGKGPVLKVHLFGDNLSTNNGNLKLAIESPRNNLSKKVTTTFTYGVFGAGKSDCSLLLDVDTKSYTFNSSINIHGDKRSLVDFVLVYPSGEQSRVYFLIYKMDSDKFKGVSKLENLGDFSMDLDFDGIFRASHDFYLRMDVNSQELQLDKAQFQVYSVPVGPKHHKFKFNLMQLKENIISAITTYHVTEEGSKYMVDGSGTVQIRGAESSTNFRYTNIKTKYGDELGTETTLNMEFDNENILYEYIVTANSYKHWSIKACRYKEPCAQVYFTEKSKTPDYNLKLGYDLKKFGGNTAFSIKIDSHSSKDNLSTYDLDLHLTQMKSTYETLVHMKCDKGEHSGSVKVSSPKRQMMLETSTKWPKNTWEIFPLHHETTVQLDKENPNTRLHFLTTGNYEIVKDKHNLYGTVTFSSPKLYKNFTISSKNQYNEKTNSIELEYILDIFRRENQKVVITLEYLPLEMTTSTSHRGYTLDAHIDGKNLGFDAQYMQKINKTNNEMLFLAYGAVAFNDVKKELLVQMEKNPDFCKLSINTPTKDILKYEAKNDIEKCTSEVKLMLHSANNKDYKINSKLVTSPPYSISATAHTEGSPKSVSLYAKTVPLSLLELKLTRLVGAEDKPMADVVLDLSGTKTNKLTSFNWDGISELITDTSEELNKIIIEDFTMAKKSIKDLNEDVHKFTTKISPSYLNFDEVYYLCRLEAKKFFQEMKEDKIFGHLTQTVHNIFLFVKNTVDTIVGGITYTMESFNKVPALAGEFFNNYYNKFAPEIIQGLRDISKEIFYIASENLRQAYTYMGRVSELLVKDLSEFVPTLRIVCDGFADFICNFTMTISRIQYEAVELYKCIARDFMDSIFFQTLSFSVESAVNIIKRPVWDFMNFITKIFPSDTSKILLTLADRVIFPENYNGINIETLKQVYMAFVYAFNDLEDTEETGLNKIIYDKSLEALIDFGNIIFDDDTYDAKFIKSHWSGSYNPIDMLPPYKLRGYVVRGQNFFTFDGEYFKLSGTDNCSYTLVEDTLDGNFSVVINVLKDGDIEPDITLNFKYGNSINVNHQTKLLLNNNIYGFPVLKKDIQAWRTREGFFIQSEYGITIACINNLDICAIDVSGYYHGKLNGLLGNGNYEQYDDQIKPDTKVSDNNECNDFKLQHVKDTTPNDLCQSIFGDNSYLSSFEYAVKIDNYRQACDLAMVDPEGEEKEKACLIASSYVMACRRNGVSSASLPDECDQCQVEEKRLDIDESMEVELPEQKADIMIAVETTMANKNTYKYLVEPVIGDIVKALKEKGVDVEVTLMGISPKYDMPIYYDIENPELEGAKITFHDESRSTNWTCPIQTQNTYYDNMFDELTVIVQEFLNELGLTKFFTAYGKLAADVQMRPKATKTFIMVHSDPCLNDTLIGDDIFLTGYQTPHLITPLVDIQGHGVDGKQIIGFSKKNVILMDQVKQRDIKFVDVKNYEDFCTEYTEDNHGYVYSSTNFFDMEEDSRQDYIDKMASNILETINNVELEVECKCGEDFSSFYNPSMQCSVESRKKTSN